MSERPVFSRREAVAVLEEGRGRSRAARPSPKGAMTKPGVGGGTWSPKDLIGHLASWEEYALDAIAAWEREERAPIDDLQFTLSISALNDQAVGRKEGWSLAKVRRDADRIHEELLAAVGSMSDPRRRAPTTPRGRKPHRTRHGAIHQGSGGAHIAHTPRTSRACRPSPRSTRRRCDQRYHQDGGHHGRAPRRAGANRSRPTSRCRSRPGPAARPAGPGSLARCVVRLRA
jgi:hypothetical protein